MKKFWLFMTVLVAALLAGGAIFLLTWDFPAPSERVEKTFPDDRFPR